MFLYQYYPKDLFLRKMSMSLMYHHVSYRINELLRPNVTILYAIAYVVFTKGHDARRNETETIDLHAVVYAFTKTFGSAFLIISFRIQL